LHHLVATPGGRAVLLLELGQPGQGRPAVLVVANMEGNCPPASEAALQLADQLLNDWRGELDERNWFIVPVGNPDGYARFFRTPREARFVNDRAVNDDHDDAFDEDGAEDLNGDGYITMMRQPHPEGSWRVIEGNPVLMKKAERAKGEAGEYRLFAEGTDNDGDGKINEDGPGGTNPGRNFPHNFEHYVPSHGGWAASEVESRALLEFAFDHPEIALVLTFGRSNSLREVPEGSRQQQATQKKYKLPGWMARRVGVDEDEEFPLSELVEMARDFTGNPSISEEMVLQWLGAGAATQPDRKDVPYWKEITEKYAEFIEAQGLDGERLDPPDFAPGCVEDWAYYQFGVPSFSIDFWTVPVKKEEATDGGGELTPDAIEKMTNEEFIELGEEKIAAFLKAQDAPPQYSAAMVIGALKGGMFTTGKIAEFIRKGKRKEEADGADEVEQALFDHDPELFVAWQPYDHPTLGPVEIGGMIAHAELAPPPAVADSLVAAQLPFVRELAGFLPRLAVRDLRVERRGDRVWKVEAWVANEGFLPYPTHQGRRCQRPPPATVELAGQDVEFLEGRSRRVLDVLAGSGGVEKTHWIVGAAAGTELELRVLSPSAGNVQRTIRLEAGGTR
jgi:hypothetical protein